MEVGGLFQAVAALPLDRVLPLQIGWEAEKGLLWMPWRREMSLA